MRAVHIVLVAIGKIDIRQVIVEQAVALGIEVFTLPTFCCRTKHDFKIVVFSKSLGISGKHVHIPHCRATIALGRISAAVCVENAESIARPVVPQCSRNLCRAAVHIHKSVGEVGLQGQTRNNSSLHPSLHTCLRRYGFIHMACFTDTLFVTEIAGITVRIAYITICFKERRETPHILVGVTLQVGREIFALREINAGASFKPRENLCLDICACIVTLKFFGVITHKALLAVISETYTVSGFA